LSESEFQKEYTLKEIENRRQSQQYVFEHTLTDVILYLLRADSEPIKGKTKQMKEIFLTMYDILPKETIQPVEFEKHHFGPYSEYVIDTLDTMIHSNLIETIGKRNKKNVAIKITPKGSEIIEKKFSKLPSDMRKLIKTKRKEWESHISTGILGLVYRDHKDYLENAILKKRFTQIDWKDTKQKPTKKTKKRSKK